MNKSKTPEDSACEDAKLTQPDPNAPNLGCATTRELLNEITARIEVDGKLDYRTYDS